MQRGMAQREQQRCRCHAAKLASGWLQRADMLILLRAQGGRVTNRSTDDCLLATLVTTSNSDCWKIYIPTE